MARDKRFGMDADDLLSGRPLKWGCCRPIRKEVPPASTIMRNRAGACITGPRRTYPTNFGRIGKKNTKSQNNRQWYPLCLFWEKMYNSHDSQENRRVGASPKCHEHTAVSGL